MSKDQQWSRSFFESARSSASTRDVAIFCASHLIWFIAGFAIGKTYPLVYSFVPMVFLPWGVCLLLSEWIRRPRPFQTETYTPTIHLFVQTPSFPSSHSTLAFAFVAAFIHDVTVWPVLLVAAVCVALGRVAVGVHYFSDVIVGAGLGIGLGYAVRVAALLFLA